ncbi:carbohydrate ABC transporter permease [Nocardioides aequoreus]|uniref:carbohydrate ABC transporter permease n=1 Tax=Nocardioides aequoreus TaxID=397278 RepID=UPI000AF55374|nr:sugar ABC transporter permease [Nocardioides aequoreus]
MTLLQHDRGETSADRARARSAQGRPPSRRGSSASADDWRRRGEVLLLVTPALLLFCCFVLLPVAQAAYYSVWSWNGLTPLEDFVGLDNYREALGDPVFRGAIAHNFWIVGLSLLVQLPLGLGVALLLNRPMRGRALLRMLIFVPYVLAEAMAAVIWLLMLQPDGFMDAALESVGLGRAVQLWLGDPGVVMVTMMVVLTWKYVGFAIILFLAGLQGIPPELHEAASLDGASWWQAQRAITLPLLGPTIRIWAFLSMIGSLQLFDLVWIMTGGGPANASSTMATYLISQGFERFRYGYGSAVAVVLFAISLVVALLYQRFVLRRDVADRLGGRRR